MSTNGLGKPFPASELVRKRVRENYKELMQTGHTADQASRKLGYSKWAIYRMFIMDEDPWRIKYGPYDTVKAILAVKKMVAEGKDMEDAIRSLGIPVYKFRQWVEKYGENPVLPPEPRIRIEAREARGTPRRIATTRKKIAAAPKALPRKEPGLIGQLVVGLTGVTNRIGEVETKLEKLITFLGIQEVEEG